MASPTATGGGGLAEAEALKGRGNDAFRQGDVDGAIECYTSALKCVDSAHNSGVVAATLLSNRAMCHLKQPTPQSLKSCVDDCAAALERLDRASETDTNSLRGKILYRRARALFLLSQSPAADEDEKEKNLNAAAKDLLQLLSFDGENKEAATLLRAVRAQHGSLGGGGGRNKISRALDVLKKVVSPGGNGAKSGEDGGKMDALQCLRIIQGALAEDIASSSEEIGRRGGVPILMGIARHGVPQGASTAKPQDPVNPEQCRVAALHILSACCSHDAFIINYAGRNALPPAQLAQVVEEEAALSNDLCGDDVDLGGGGSADVAVAAMALLVRLIVHWDHQEVVRFFAPKISEDGTIEENVSSLSAGHMAEVDGSSICRVATAAFLWGAGDGAAADTDARPPRAALDLISAWTASDLDALDAASDACYAPSSDSAKQAARGKKASQHRLSQEDIKRMKPRQVAAHRQREGEYRRSNLKRAIEHIDAFCSDETGGLDAMLACASRTNDHRLRREVGLQIGRMMSVYEEDDDAKKLILRALGCTNWKVGKEDEDGNEIPVSTLTIEEIDEEKEAEMKMENEEGLFAAMKRGQLTASLLIGRPNVGTWALKHGWSDGLGIDELKRLISSNDPRAMSIASELVSAASSVESARPLLITLVQEGTLENLLSHPDADVRSGAASCAAKIGLASKALSADEGEAMGLLDIAIELLFLDEKGGSQAKDEALNKVPSVAVGESTSMDRGIEVLAYLASKTFVKEKVASGYKPAGSPASRPTTLQRLVEIALAPNSGDAQMAYGLAGIFNLLAVSIETLRKEAFIGKEITKEQYDQLQSMGRTKEENAVEAKKEEREGDDPTAVAERIRKLANANVPRAMVKLLEGSKSDATQEKLLEGMGRMASEPSVRGIMIQQGCLTTCLQLDKGDKTNEAEKKILRQAQSCVAKLLVTTNPGILTVSQRSGSVGPLLKLIKDSDALDLQHFEALMSLTNLAGFDNETKNRVVAQKGIPILSYSMFSDHPMVRTAGTEALCNMVPHPEMMEYLVKPDNLRVWIAFSLDYEENLNCARAAVGCLAMAAPDPEFAKALVAMPNFDEFARAMMECGQLELMHRALALMVGLIEHGGECKEAVVATGAGPFCDAYVKTYQDEKKTMKDFNMSQGERGSLAATLTLAKEVSQLLG
ncbi:hypothetical protein ACHAXT_010942 [Thalassiosira profunda]